MRDVWYMLSDHQQYVYHYTKASTLAEHILPNRTLRFSSFACLNDPREYKDFDLDFYAATAVGDDFPAIKAEMELALKAGWKIACFVADPIEAVIGRRGRVLSAGELDRMHERGHSRPRMWAQYADGHSGACLVFRKQSLDQAIRSYAQRACLRVFCGSVTYCNVPIVGQLGPGPFSFSMDSIRRDGLTRTADGHINQYFRDLYLTKNQDWEAEREFRWLMRGADENEVFVDFESSLVGIAIGELFPDEFKPAVGRFAVKNDITTAMMDWRRAIPQPNVIAPRMLLPSGDPDQPSSGW